MSIQDAVNEICKLYGHAPSGGAHFIYEVLGEFNPGHPDEAERDRRRKELKFETSQSIEVKGGTRLSAAEAKTALEEAMTIIEAVGTTGIYSRVRKADEWMKRYFPAWA